MTPSEFLVSRHRTATSTCTEEVPGVMIKTILPYETTHDHYIDRERAVQLIRDLMYHMKIRSSEVV